ncbi:MAG: hypothetical protein RBS43_05075, partial [Candidatus Cloacimonas sp.]|nr:hypothetical protein [Candidatus Cloacimonas sp.]
TMGRFIRGCESHFMWVQIDNHHPMHPIVPSGRHFRWVRVSNLPSRRDYRLSLRIACYLNVFCTTRKICQSQCGLAVWIIGENNLQILC